MPESGIPLSEWSGSGATERLRETITEFNETTAKQTAQLVQLTRVLVALTMLLFVGLVVQVGIALLDFLTRSGSFGRFSALVANSVDAFGLVLGIVGVLLIWRYGLPEHLSRTGAIHLILEQSDDHEASKANDYVWTSRLGLSVVLVGFGFQLASHFL